MNIIYKSIDELAPYANNPRKNDNAVEAVANSIFQFGWKQPVVIDCGGVIVAGHTRVKAAKKLGITQIPCLIADDLTEEQIKAFRLADNSTAELAEWNFELLESEMIEIDEIDMCDFGFEFEELNQDYKDFVEKFKPKKTTDDCYTPPIVFNAIKDYVCEKYNINPNNCVRPFYPGGDYQNFSYPNNCVVLDNPPFSILSEIVYFYNNKNIDYFLFAPMLTNFDIGTGTKTNHIITSADITYENGALVNTSFVTNLGEYIVEAEPQLNKIIKQADYENTKKDKQELPKYQYPDNVITSADIAYLAKQGCDFKLKANEIHFIRELDSQKEQGKSLFGAGFLISEAKAKAKAKAEAKAKNRLRWALSDREKEIIKGLG